MENAHCRMEAQPDSERSPSGLNRATCYLETNLAPGIAAEGCWEESCRPGTSSEWMDKWILLWAFLYAFKELLKVSSTVGLEIGIG